jgi:formate dehydrogenase assembly factor FdhD
MIFINHLMMTGEVFNKFVIGFVADEEILTGAETKTPADAIDFPKYTDATRVCKSNSSRPPNPTPYSRFRGFIWSSKVCFHCSCVYISKKGLLDCCYVWKSSICFYLIV